jgi:hypothetical protein
MDYLKAAEAGTQAGIERGRLALSAQQEQARQQEAAARIAQEAEQHQASNALSRDALQLNTQTARERYAAGNALRLEQMKQAGLLGQARLDQTGKLASDRNELTAQRNADLAKYQEGENQNRSDMLDLREKIAGSKPEASTISLSSGSDANNKTEIKLTKSEYANYLKAQKQWASQAPPETAGFWGSKNPAYADYLKKNPAPDPTDFLPSAASTLTQGAGTNLPDAPAAPAASPNLPANPAASSLSAPGNYSAPQFQAKLPGASKGNPSPDDIAYLRANPKLAAKFDARFGAGLAAQILAQ